MKNRFCWMDIKTHDIQATAEYFTALFDWQHTVDELDPRRPTVITTAGKQIGGLSDLTDPIYPPGTPPHIAFYLTVDDVDRCTDTALAHGAQMVLEPFDAGARGRVSTLIDPVGAPVSLWQPREFAGWEHPSGTANAPAAMVLASPEPARARDFYRNVLGSCPPGAEFVTAEQFVAPQWEIVIGVEDLDTVADRMRGQGQEPNIHRAGDVAYLRPVSPEGLVMQVRRA